MYIFYSIVMMVLVLMGALAFPLSQFICAIEDGTVCDACLKKDKCFARRPFGKNSDCVSEWMFFSYLATMRYCPNAVFVKFREVLTYCLISIIILFSLFWSKGWSDYTFLLCISCLMLLALSIVDWNTQYIPVEYTGVIFLCGLIHLFADFSNWLEYLIGLIAVSGFLLLLDKVATPILARKEKYQDVEDLTHVIGGGDIKLMAATGLLLGWKLNFIALGIGCIAGSAIQLALMKIKESEKPFALGPYLSLGTIITMICGEQLVSWYLNLLGVKPL